MHFEKVILEDVEHLILKHDNIDLMALAPAHGARLTQLAFLADNKPVNVLWEVSPEDCKTGAWSKNEILFPWPNRIEDGKYEYRGKTYQLPINEKANNNALHGMITQASFEIVESEKTKEFALVKLKYSYDGNNTYYPFAFDFWVTYSYGFKEGFQIQFDVTNTGNETLPFGLGWHPYLKLSDTLENVTLDIPQTDHLVLGERNLPTGKESPFTHTSLEMSEWPLDDCFRLKQEGMFCTLKYGDLELKMSGSPEYRYLQLFTPEGFGTVAIEPMTSGVNVYNNKEGIRYLDANESFQVFFKIEH
ncbi:aldose 1-epimerase [Marinoscillum sp. MHG1-6]|uniref:aldose 1-epimerase n=1 Tax=Marinoscillum sp. MHG1-6 TaxID=2959627 RepID=UPI002157CC6B|nr:hypothetical protein [Marinoscillum sp. MHG1-6]